MRLNNFFIFSIYLVVVNAYKSYEDYKVYDVLPGTEEHVQILHDLRKEGYDYWTDVYGVGSNVRIMVSPTKDEQFVRYCKSVGLEPVVSINNVQKLIDDQLKPNGQSKRSSTLGSFSWNRYHTIAEIDAWLNELVEMYPNIVTRVRMGVSNGDRPIHGVIIDFKPGARGDSPLIGMIEGGIHAREWISPATVTWIIKEFLTSTNPEVRSLAENFIWHIFPVTNPDGYAYTFSNNRMWRKNRNEGNQRNCTFVDNDISNGIDLNRNFNFLWMTTGASSDPCSETYAGPRPGSEPETQAISNYVLTLKSTGNVVYYFAFHSFSQMILVPYSHASGVNVLEAENYADMYEIAIRGADKLAERHGTPYTVGTSADILYEVSGSSFDWVKGVANIPIVYLFELRDVGEYGFLLPTEQIIPNSEEIVDCLIEVDRITRVIGYYSHSGAGSIVSSLVILLLSSVLFVLN